MSEFSRTIDQIFSKQLHGTHLPCPPGFLRGVEVLGSELGPAIERSCRIYRRKHGRNPDLISPITFTEKQVLFKFFGLIPEQSPSDKLRSPGFLPESHRNLVKIPKKIWISESNKLPENDEIQPGFYYLKSNHGSATNMPIVFPVAKKGRAKIEQKTDLWLKKTHNETLALWWYETMPRNIYLEEDLRNPDGDAPDWKLFVCNGKVAVIQVDTGRYTNHIQNIYSRDGKPLNFELYYGRGEPTQLPKQIETMISVAEAIGRNFDFIRVDMFLLHDEVYLGEIGLVPNGTSIRVRSPELDGFLGGAWHAPWMGRVEEGWKNSHYHSVEYKPFEYQSDLL